MYFHREIKTSLADEAYLLGCIMNNGNVLQMSSMGVQREERLWISESKEEGRTWAMG